MNSYLYKYRRITPGIVLYDGFKSQNVSGPAFSYDKAIENNEESKMIFFIDC